MLPSRLSRRSAFTLIELIIVIGIICTLMGLVLGVQRYAQAKSSRSRAEAQIAAFAAAAEAYKADNAIYPRSAETDVLASVGSSSSSGYVAANLALYIMLSGDSDLNGKVDSTENMPNAAPSYFAFVNSQIQKDAEKVAFIRDPWGKPFGYSTMRAAAIQNGADNASAGHNVTYDLWSTANQDAAERAWISNW